jgi:co-chaperonin GroES (HSP10)
MPFMRMSHDVDPAETIRNELGNIDNLQVFHNQVLIAVYIRPTKTKGGIMLADSTRDEDKYQGKVGMIIKMGPEAFVDPTNKWFTNVNVKVGDWVYFRVSDGWSLNVHGVQCRMIDDTDIRGRVEYPDEIW